MKTRIILALLFMLALTTIHGQGPYQGNPMPPNSSSPGNLNPNGPGVPTPVYTGYQGPTGLSGNQGPAMPQGPIGQPTYTGFTGITGTTGITGPAALTGPTGEIKKASKK